MKKAVTVIFSLLLIVCIVGVCSCVIAFFNDDFDFGTEFDAYDFDLDYNSMIYYTDADGNDVEYDQISGTVNRIWADLDDISVDVQNAFVARRIRFEMST